MTIYDKFLYEDRLDEMAYKIDGDYDFGDLNYVKSGIIMTKSDILMSEKSEKEDRIYHLTKQGKYYLLGTDTVEKLVSKSGKIVEKERLLIVAAMELKPTKEIDSLGYKNVYEINGVEVGSSYRRKGLGYLLYKMVLKQGITLLGDLYQYENARRIWSKFSQFSEFKVDIIDIEKPRIIETNVEIDKDDSRVWSYIDSTNKREKKIGRTRRVVLHY